MRVFVLFLVVIVSSCTPPVVFDKAYPTDQADLEIIPAYLQGSYICESDSTLVIISEYSVTLHQTHYFDTNARYIEERSDCKVEDDKMYMSGRQECIPLTVVNDSMVRGIVDEVDTLFAMGPGSVARKYQGHLVISQEIKPKQWAVSLLTPEMGGDITYRAITDKTKIKNVARVTHTTDITTEDDKNARYVVKPTMKEFDALLSDERVFIECEYLHRVSIEEVN